MPNETLETVELQRSVRFGRLLIGGAILGAIVASLITLFFPVKEGALYTMGQIVGFMLLVGGIIGLALGGTLGLVLTLVARRKHGTGVISVVSESDFEDGIEDESEDDSEGVAENEPDGGPGSASENDPSAD